MFCAIMTPSSEAVATPTIHERIGNLEVTVTFYSPHNCEGDKDGRQRTTDHEKLFGHQDSAKRAEDYRDKDKRRDYPVLVCNTCLAQHEKWTYYVYRCAR